MTWHQSNVTSTKQEICLLKLNTLGLNTRLEIEYQTCLIMSFLLMKVSKGEKGQESIQSSTTPDPGYQTWN